MAKYKREYKPTMSVDDFEEANTDYYQEQYMERYPEHAYQITNGDFAHYIDHIDWGDLKNKMIELYTDWIDAN